MWILIILPLVAYIVWKISVIKVRRDNSLEPIINELIVHDYHDWMDFSHLKYENVRKYAIKNGAEEILNPRDTSSTAAMAFDFRTVSAVYYKVVIRKLLDSSVSVMVLHDTKNGLLQYDYALSSSDSYSHVLSSLISQAVDNQVHAIAPYVKYDLDKVYSYCDNDVEIVRGIENEIDFLVLWFDYKDQEDIPVTIYRNKAGSLAVSPWRSGIL